MSFISWSGSLDSSEALGRSLGSSKCHLTPAAGAFTAILSAFIGSVINGLTNGWFVAFMTGWIAWFAIFRVLVGGLFMFYRSITDSWGPGRNEDFGLPPPYHTHPAHLQGSMESESFNLLAANQNGYTSGRHAAISSVPAQHGEEGMDLVAPKKATFRGMLANIWPSATVVRRGQGNEPAANSGAAAFSSSILKAPTNLNREITALGWFALAYTALYAPTTQILFLASNASRHDIGSVKIVKGLTTAVTALPLCIDCRVRYADSLKWPGARYAFNIFVGLSCLLQGAICATLLITGWIDITADGEGLAKGPMGRIIPVVYVFFALVWMLASFTTLAMRDGGRQGAGKTHWAGYILDVGMGAFAGVFLAAPALFLYLDAAAFGMSSGPSDLGKYLSCERQGWRKFAAVAP